jgi:hypothetical protein
VLPPWGCGPLLCKHIQWLAGIRILKEKTCIHGHRTIPMTFQMSKEGYENNNIQDNNKEEGD